MSPLWVRLLLVLVYLALLVVVSGVLELLLWCQDASGSQPVVPLALTVRQLKALLDARGVSYMGAVEKKELAHLLQASGDVTSEEAVSVEASSLEGRQKVLGAPSPFHFTSGPHLWEEVEDCKDSVWLVQVVGARREPLLDDLSWRRVVGALAPLAVRTGVFHCQLDPRLCKRKSWHSSQLVLALPRGTRAKDRVVLTSFTSSRAQSVIEWVRDHMSVRVKRVNRARDIESEWLSIRPQNASRAGGKDSLAGGNNAAQVNVLLLTHLLHPPLFLAALSIKFTGRVKFGIYTVSSDADEEEVKKKVKVDHLPAYVVVTPKTRLLYGKRGGELLTFGAASLFLATLQPEANDVFLASLMLVNVLAWVEIFFPDLVSTSSRWWPRHLIRCLGLLVAYNFWLFLAWLLLCGAANLGPIVWALQTLSDLTLSFGVTRPASFLRSVFLNATCHPLLSTLLFAATCVGFALLWQRQRRSDPLPADPPWWDLFGEGESLLAGCLFRPVPTGLSRAPQPHLDLEEGLDIWIEHMAVPNLWLQPVVNTDYVNALPTWRHRRDSPDAEIPSPDTDSSSESQCPEDDYDEEPEAYIHGSECAVCLEKYRRGDLLCGLPCGHVYHDACVKVWLGGGKNHCCPVCRWPAYRSRPKAHSE